MDYSNTKKGLKKLLISEIMLIIVNIESLFSNVYVALIAVLVALIGYIIGLKGLKLISKDYLLYVALTNSLCTHRSIYPYL